MIAGRYALDREIGRGGMGAVWLGTDEVLGRAVALKRVGFGPGGATPDLDRAEREARLAARLNHPHVVAIYDLVEDGDERWLVMEYVAGLTLAELVRAEGPLQHNRAAAIVRQATDALAAAHAAGIVHRDVKPSNILVSPDGQVKLSDFGIARAQADASLTQTGLVTGSPAYLAPEVASGQQATAASDMWSLGATLYHSLAGRAPYEVGDNVLGALYRIVHEDPPRLRDAGWLDPLLRSTMATDPGRRWTSAQARDYLAAGPSATSTLPMPPPDPPSGAEPVTLRTRTAPPVPLPPVPPSRDRRRGGLLAVLSVVALVVVVALGGWLVTRDDDTPTGTGSSGERPTRSASSGPSESESTEPAAVTADGMENFIEDYLATVTTDPHAAWEQLTPGFQAQSGNFGQYQKFWNTISTADVISAQADPDTMQITYTVEYIHPDGSKTRDDVTLTLEGTDGDFRIAAEG